MKTAFSSLQKVLGVATLVVVHAAYAAADSVQRYEIESSRLSDAETLLLQQWNKALWFDKDPIEKQLAEVRKQRLQIETLKAEAVRAAAEAALGQQNKAPSVSVANTIKVDQTLNPSPVALPPPTPTSPSVSVVPAPPVESPDVLVKGVLSSRGRLLVMLQDGRIVGVGDEFTTTYKGKTMKWRCEEAGANPRFVRTDGNVTEPASTNAPLVQPLSTNALSAGNQVE